MRVAVNKLGISAGAFFLILLLAVRAPAQITIGDDISAKLNGNLSFGYTGDYGNLTASDHGLTAGGTADLSGSYYNPGFLAFDIQPFYNQSRANSSYQSLTDASGVNASAAIFSGSHFPGSVSYTKSYNSEGNFGVPGIANYTSHGDSGIFSAGWGINVPDLPHVQLSYQKGSNDYSIYGTDTNGSSRFDTFSANSSYMLAGFNLNAGYRHTDTDAEIPDLVSGQPAETSDSSGNSFFAGVSHHLPLNGAFSIGASRSGTSEESSGGSYNGTIDLLNSGLSFAPLRNLNFGTTAQYDDNLVGSLYSTVIAAGGVVQNASQENSHSLDVTTYAIYRLPSAHLTFTGNLEDREQSIFGSTLGETSITGNVNYSDSFLGGFVSLNNSVTENLLAGKTYMGLLSSVNYSRRLFGWNFSGGFNYAQNQQTVLITYSTSGYGYNGSLGRKFGEKTYLVFSASGAKSGLTGNSGSQSFNQSYSTTLNLQHWVSLNGSYSKSSGNSILTASGLVATPVPLPVLPSSSILLYGGHAYSFGFGSSPMKRLTMSASYARAFSDVINSSLTSNNRTDVLIAQFDYQFRQMHFIGGYTKLVQGFSASGTPPTMIGSFYIGVTRWFNFF